MVNQSDKRISDGKDNHYLRASEWAENEEELK